MTERETAEPRSHALTPGEQLALNADDRVPWDDRRLLFIEWSSVLGGVVAGAAVDRLWSWREAEEAVTTMPGGAWLALAISVVYAVDRWSAELTGPDSDFFKVVSRGVKLFLPMFAVGVATAAVVLDLFDLQEPLGVTGGVVLAAVGLFGMAWLSRVVRQRPTHRGSRL